MACNTSCRLCDRLVISEAVTFDGTNLVIDLPAGSYGNGCRYCIVVAQTIPAATTITAPVVITISGGTETYPVNDRCCAQVSACAIRTRTKYPVVVTTTATGGAFRVLRGLSCAPVNALSSIDGTAPATGAEGGGAA